MNLKMYALIGTVSGIAVALGVHHGKGFFAARQEVSEYHQQLMLAMEQPLEVNGDPSQSYPDGYLPADATPEPGYPVEAGSMRPSIQFKNQIPPLPPLANTPFLILKKTSNTVKQTKDPVWNLELISKDGTVLDTLKAVTGRATRQTANRHVAGTKAPLPTGTYRIDRSGIERGPFSDPELGNGFWVPITPLFSTGRSDLGFHVDPSWGKLNGESGTSGCIGLENTDATVKLVTWIKHFNVSKLIVQN
jgi:lipoprotein-anchoring transpeptidase ErfK/SrfK